MIGRSKSGYAIYRSKTSAWLSPTLCVLNVGRKGIFPESLKNRAYKPFKKLTIIKMMLIQVS